jgi:GNAT superfamily N-acetyltransferase
MMMLAADPRTQADASNYSAVERLRDGRQVEIRALQPNDVDGLKSAIAHISLESLYRRFFGPKRFFSDKEVAHFMNVDFVKHVALVATADAEIVAGGRYFVVAPGAAEVAFAIVDEYQGQGLGTALLRHLISIARKAGLKELVAHVLPDNRPMLSVFSKSGLRVRTGREHDAVKVTLELS